MPVVYTECVREPGVLTASETREPVRPAISTIRADARRCRVDTQEMSNRHSGDVELTLPGHPLERLGRTLDPVLAVVAVDRKQLDHPIGSAGGRTSNIAGSKKDGLSNGEFVLQHPL